MVCRSYAIAYDKNRGRITWGSLLCTGTVSDSRIKRLFPLRTRVVVEIISFLRLPENHISLPVRKRDKAAVLLRAILVGYDALCSTILMRAVLRTGLDKLRGARSNVPFELHALTKRYGQETVDMFNKYGSGSKNVNSLFQFIRNSILYTTRTGMATKSRADFGIREKQPFEDDWLSIGLAGADVVEKRDTDGMPLSIVYRFDEPLTRDVCSMLARLASPSAILSQQMEARWRLMPLRIL